MFQTKKLGQHERFDVSKAVLEQTGSTLKVIGVYLGWRENMFAKNNAQQFDIDSSIIPLAVQNSSPVWFGNPGSCEYTAAYFNNAFATVDPKDQTKKIFPNVDGSMVYYGDNRSGLNASSQQDWCERTIIYLDKINPQIQQLDSILTIDEAQAKRQTFGMIDNAFIRIINEETGDVLVQYDVSTTASNDTAMQIAQIYRNTTGGWSIKGVGQGFEQGLVAFLSAYGAQAQ